LGKVFITGVLLVAMSDLTGAYSTVWRKISVCSYDSTRCAVSGSMMCTFYNGYCSNRCAEE